MRLFESDSYVPQGGTVYGFLDDSILKGRISGEAGEGGLAPEQMTMSNVGHTEKKRRLSKHQVKALEMSFGMDSKLEAEKKTELAQQLHLQPRQVAIWFQNRRARCKTKQLEKDYINLKELYDTAIAEKEELQTQILKMKILLNMQEEDQRRLSEQQLDKGKPTLKAEKEVEVKPAPLQCPDDAVSGLSSKTEQSEVTDAGSRDEEKDTRRSPHIEKLAIEMVSGSAPYIFVKGEEGYVCQDEFFTHLEEQESILCFNWGN